MEVRRRRSDGPAAVPALAAAAGPVDVLVNNAARASNVGIEELTADELQQTLAVNLIAPTLLARELVPGMRERGWGRIVNVTSATLRLGGPSGPAYVASKGGLVGLTRTLARSLGATGITVERDLAGCRADRERGRTHRRPQPG